MINHRWLPTIALLAAFGSPAIAQDFPLTIAHAKGDTVLEAPAERVVVFSEEFIEVAVGLDIAPVAVGLWRNEVTPGAYTKLPYLDQSIPGEPVAFDGLEPNFEALLEVDPDFIVYHLNINDGTADVTLERLSIIAPTIAVVGSTPGAWKEVATAMAQATGHPETAEKVIAEFDAAVAEYQQAMVPIAAAHPTVTAIFALGENTGYFNDRHNIGSNFARLGFSVTSPLGDAIGPSGFEVASPETVPSIDADTIFVWRRTPSAYDDLLARRPQPVIDVPLPPGIGHTGPYTELLYLQIISEAMSDTYGS